MIKSISQFAIRLINLLLVFFWFFTMVFNTDQLKICGWFGYFKCICIKQWLIYMVFMKGNLVIWLFWLFQIKSTVFYKSIIKNSVHKSYLNTCKSVAGFVTGFLQCANPFSALYLLLIFLVRLLFNFRCPYIGCGQEPYLCYRMP